MDRHRRLLALEIYGEAGKDDHGQPKPPQDFDADSTTCDELTKMDIRRKQEAIEEISDKASKEFGNAKTMEKMRDEWAPLLFAVDMPQGKDSYILKGDAVEEI